MDAKRPLLQMTKEEALLRLLEKEISYYKVIWELLQQEAKLFESGRPLQEIIPFIKKRRILFGCIEEIEQAIRPLKKHWVAKTQRDDERSLQCQNCLACLDRLIQAILSLDEQNQKHFASRLQQLRHLKATSTPAAQ